MRRLAAAAAHENGAFTVLFGVVMIALLIAAALVIDAGRLYHEKYQLQNGADAAALAVAFDCARDPDTCAGSAASTAQAYANANVVDGAALIAGSPSFSGRTVTVALSSAGGGVVLNNPGGGGPSSVNVVASATAAWGALIFAEEAAGLAIAGCALGAVEPGETIIIRHDDCGETNTAKPGAFGLLDDCNADLEVGDRASGSTGGSSTGCAAFSDPAYLDEVLLVPIYGSASGGGSSVRYRVSGFTALKLTSWVLGEDPAEQYPAAGAPLCDPETERCIEVEFASPRLAPPTAVPGSALGFAVSAQAVRLTD